MTLVKLNFVNLFEVSIAFSLELHAFIGLLVTKLSIPGIVQFILKEKVSLNFFLIANKDNKILFPISTHIFSLQVDFLSLSTLKLFQADVISSSVSLNNN